MQIIKCVFKGTRKISRTPHFESLCVGGGVMQAREHSGENLWWWTPIWISIWIDACWIALHDCLSLSKTYVLTCKMGLGKVILINRWVQVEITVWQTVKSVMNSNYIMGVANLFVSTFVPCTNQVLLRNTVTPFPTLSNAPVLVCGRLWKPIYWHHSLQETILFRLICVLV